jgi:enoyl-CoA hydratase
MKYKNIEVTENQNIATITINRPDVLNALNKQTFLELLDAIHELEKNNTVVIITGHGTKAFIAGADIKEMKDYTLLEAKEFSALGHQVLLKLENSPMIAIAAVNGYALGGGCEVMMACDLCIASDTAVIGQPEINLGVPPGFGGTQRLPRRIGKLKAKELLLTAKNLNAEQAKQIGLVNTVVPQKDLMSTVEKLALTIASKSPIQTAFIKELINKGLDIDLANACALEVSYFSSSFSTQDQKEGMNAFLEKRKPQFKGK